MRSTDLNQPSSRLSPTPLCSHPHLSLTRRNARHADRCFEVPQPCWISSACCVARHSVLSCHVSPTLSRPQRWTHCPRHWGSPVIIRTQLQDGSGVWKGMSSGVETDVGDFNGESGARYPGIRQVVYSNSHRTDSVSPKVRLDTTAWLVTGANPLHIVCSGTLVDLPTPMDIGWLVG